MSTASTHYNPDKDGLVYCRDLSDAGGRLYCGDEEVDAQRLLVQAATKMLPSNRLVRARYMRSLAPRWGGSNEEMNSFLADAKRTGATQAGLWELEAIIADDLGDQAFSRGDEASAIRNFLRAQELGAKAGEEVPSELTHSWYFRCRLPQLASYCR